MTDFENKKLEIGDEVVFALNEYKTTKLQRGIVTAVDVKQVNMIMAKIEFHGCTKRVAQHNILKIKGTPND